MPDFDYEKRFITFSEFLNFLLFEHGATPKNSPHAPGEPWRPVDFVERVEVDDRTVRYWLSGKKCPNNLRLIERALFGSNPKYDDWKMALRRVWRKSKRRNVKNLPSATPEAEIASSIQPSPQILHPEIRPVPGFTGREDLLDALDKALWQHGGTAALTNAI